MTKTPRGFSSICYLENHIFLVSDTGILKYSVPDRSFEEILSKQDTGLQPYQVLSKGKDILFSEPEVKKVFAYDTFTKNLRTFAGKGNNELTDKPYLDASFQQLCGLAVEFENVVSVTDAMSTSLSMMTTTNNTVSFWGALYGVFSIQESGEEYKRYNLEEAHCLISNCVTTLETNQQKIVNDLKEKLPKLWICPERKVAQKTIESVKLIEWAVSKLMGLTKKYQFGHTDLQSWMTLDVEHFLATIHYRTPAITMFQYCRSLTYQEQ